MPESVEAFAPGEAVRVKESAFTAFAGREGIVISGGYPDGYWVRLGVADELWFADDEVERV